MNKIEKLFKGLGLLLSKPYFINKLFEDNDYWEIGFRRKYPHLTGGLPLVDLQDVIQKSEFKISNYSFLDGGSLPTDYALLKGLAANIPDCEYFEIGTWRGESTYNVSEVAKSCTSLNLDENQMRELGYSEQRISQMGYFVKDKENVQLMYGDSSDFDFSKLEKKFDLIFIDGNHHHWAIKQDTENVFKHILNENGIVVWHDYGYSPDKIRFEVFQAILDGVPEDKHRNLYHVRNTNCAIYHPGNFTTRALKFPDFPDFTYNLSVVSMGNRKNQK